MSVLKPKTLTLLFVQILLLSSACFADLSKAIETFDQSARSHGSDAVIIKKNGEVLYQMSSKEDFEVIAAWSVTKSFISLGIGLLYDEGKIHPDQPVSAFLPGWDQGNRSKVTIRQLLTHTSGIDHSFKLEDLSTILAGDSLQIACDKELVHEPGTTFHYNNSAVNLLAGIIETVSGERADLFIKSRILDQIGITRYRWDLDGAGHALGMCGLHIRADELIKLGELMLNKGVWKGQRLISEDWLEESLTVSFGLSDTKFRHRFDGCGFLWWVNNQEPRFFTASGVLGQYCAVFPDEGVVAVRQHDYRRHSSWESVDESVKYRGFFNDVREFIKEMNSENFYEVEPIPKRVEASVSSETAF